MSNYSRRIKGVAKEAANDPFSGSLYNNINSFKW